MKHFKLFTLIFVLTCIYGCSKETPVTTNHSAPKPLAPYLYHITFYDYSIDKATAFFTSVESALHGGACSVVRNGNFIGRNLDFLYNETAEFVIQVPAAPGRYASIGVSSCDFFLTKEIVDSQKDSPYIELIPYFTTDGVNDQGVYISINMAPTGDSGYTTGTNPGAQTLSASMVVRYVLDNCKSAKEACEMLSKMNITTVSFIGEFHYLIADANDTYVVELIDNKVVYSKDAGCIMTNFNLLTKGYTPHAMGIERYEILKENYDEGATLDGMSNLMQRVKYSKFYDPSNTPVWYSEVNGQTWNDKVIDMNTPAATKQELINDLIEKFRKKTRDGGEALWITVHESVYDIDAKTLRVYSQEDYSKYFSFIL